MSQENVEVVRCALEAWQSEDLETWISGFDPSVEWYGALERLLEGPESVYRGHEGIRRLWHFNQTELDDFQVEAEEIRDTEGDRVVLLGRLRFRGPASRIDSESPFGMVVTIRDGKIFRSVDYLSHDEPLKAVGLEE